MIEFYGEALALCEPPHADRGGSLSNMANALVMRFAQCRELKDLDEAIKLRREALDACPPLDSSRGTYLHELAMVLRTRFQQHGNLQDIDQGILLLREGLTLCASGDLRRGMWINDLADAIQLQFKMRGDIKDMDEAIKLRREFLVLRPQGHPDRDTALNNLGNALSTRFTLRGASKDLDETIDLYREALCLRPLGHPEHGSTLNNLIHTLRNRAGSIGNEQDMDEVIELYQRALALFEPNNPRRCMILDNLGTAVQNRFERQKRPEDLEEAISLHRQALALRPPNHPQHSTSLNTLTIALRIRFQEQGSVTDLEEAIQLHRRALDLEPPPHPARGITLMHLAQCLAAMPRLHNSNVLDEAFARFEETTTYLFSSPLMRFRGAHSWAESAVVHNHSSSLAAYGAAIKLIPQLAPLDLDISSRQQMLSKLNISTLVRDAIACAIGLGQNNRAVELLEAARSVFWPQSLQMQLPLDDLATVRPDLSGRLFLLSNELEQTSLRYNARIPAENPNQQQLMSMETDSVRYRMLKQELDTAIESVRRLEGFEDFMGPKTMAKLQKAAVHGPIVILTATGINCSALIVTPDSDVQHVQLPLEIQSIPSSEFPPSLHNIRTLFSGDGCGIDSIDQDLDLLARLIGMREDRGNLSTEDTLRWLLTELWTKAVKPVFNALKFEASNPTHFVLRFDLYLCRNRTIHPGYGGARLALLLSFLSMRLGYMKNMIPTVYQNMLFRPIQPPSPHCLLVTL
jgi:tetratricopeptide (TPR) repeat protein